MSRNREKALNDAIANAEPTRNGGHPVIPKEFQKSNLVLELKAGKKRLEGALHGLSDEQCARARATQSGSVMEVLSEIVTTEFLALMEVSDRLPELPMNQLSKPDGGTRVPPGTQEPAASKSIENLLAEFGLLRSAVVRRVESRRSQSAKVDAQYGYVADVCVTRFNERVEEIERWRNSEIVGFSPERLRAEAREPELNAAIIDLSREDFLGALLDLQALFSSLLGSYYSEDLVLALGTDLTSGKRAAFERMAHAFEPVYTLLEMGLAFVGSFRVISMFQDAQGNFVSDWETVLGGSYATGNPLRWRTSRVWKDGMVIAERIESMP